MCITAAAFGLYLGLLSLSQLTVENAHVTVRTPSGDIHWLAVGTKWCTGVPGTAAYV